MLDYSAYTGMSFARRDRNSGLSFWIFLDQSQHSRWVQILPESKNSSFNYHNVNIRTNSLAYKRGFKIYLFDNYIRYFWLIENEISWWNCRNQDQTITQESTQRNVFSFDAFKFKKYLLILNQKLLFYIQLHLGRVSYVFKYVEVYS